MIELFPVLIAEDDVNDVFLLKRALKAAGVTNPIHVVHDGQEAVEYLSGLGAFSNRQLFPIPGLLLLDIKMPKKNGFEVLEWIREVSDVRMLPVVVTSSSKLQNDVTRAYSIGANAYMVKPVAIEELVHLIKSTADDFTLISRPQF